jgi:hypothetical protein
MPFKAPILRPRGSAKPGTITRSPDAAARQKLYQSARWRRLRIIHLQDNPLCVAGQEQENGPAAADLREIVECGGVPGKEHLRKILVR